ncbi:MAG: agmatine deiminase family protein [Gammaproteobacteria bacterium]|jgi:agmatine deiminase
MPHSPPSTRLPAEWEPQSGVMLTWPHSQGDWAALFAQVEPVFLRLAAEIARRESVLINCASSAMAADIRARLAARGAAAERLFFAVVASNDTWARDHGPVTVLAQGKPVLLDFQFNGWGGKYAAALDNALTGELSRRGGFGDTPVKRQDLVLEGGSIDTDGAGTLLTTRSCLLHPRRNPGLSHERIEQRLRDLLGVERVLWLKHGELEGDDTDGHIDMLARFCTTQTIAYQSCTEAGYSAYWALEAMEAELAGLRTNAGDPYRLVALPWPGPKRAADGRRLPASYANFLVINGAVLVPAYADPADDHAAQQLQDCFPDREIVQIPCLALIQQYGSLHCLTMQFPRGVELHAPGAG